MDGALWLLTFLVVVLVDLDFGLAVGVASSVGILLLQGATPYTCTLQPLPGTDIYVDTRRYANTVALKGVQVSADEHSRQQQGVYRVADTAIKAPTGPGYR